MLPDDTLLHRVRAALTRVREVEEKKMFGAIMFMVRGRMCISVGRARLMCRIDPEIHDQALTRTGCRTMTMKGREYRGYVHVDIDALKSAQDLRWWIDLALDYNGRLEAPVARRVRVRR